MRTRFSCRASIWFFATRISRLLRVAHRAAYALPRTLPLCQHLGGGMVTLAAA